MTDDFLEMLCDIYGSDIAYHEKTETIDTILEAMQKAYEKGWTEGSQHRYEAAKEGR